MSKRRTRLSRLFRRGVVAFLLVFAGMLAVGTGCGDSSSSHDTTPDAGVASGDGGGLPEGLTETEACAAYVLSVCERRNQCLGTTENCIDATVYCPDLLFADGSTRNAPSTWQCARDLRTRSCEDVVTGKTPDCISAGLRSVGEPCIAAAQCGTQLCSGSPLECGICIERRKHGEECNTSVPCVPGLICGSEGTCIEPSRENLRERLAQAAREVGERCVGTDRCVDRAYCKLSDDSAEGHCADKVALDEPCESTSACTAGTYCSIESMRCRALPGIGARCGNDISLNVLIWCDTASYCNDETERCTRLPTIGEPCATNEQLGNMPSLCDPSAYCDVSRAAPTCVALSAPGTPCEAETCVTGLSCLCEDASCTKRSCGRFRGFGETCTEVGERCYPIIGSCVDGRCHPNPTQGLLDRMCHQG